MKIRILSVILFSFVYCLSIYSQQKTEIFGGAPPNFKPQITTSMEKGETTFSTAQQVASDSFQTTVYTFGDLAVFSYFSDTQVKIYDQSGYLSYQQTLSADTIYNVHPGSGIFRIVSNKSFTILVGDAISSYVNGYFAVDEAGKGVSLKLNTWMMSGYQSAQDEFAIFAYEDNTGFTVKNLETKEIIYAGTLAKGKYFSFRQAGLLSSIYKTALQVSGTKPVSALSYTDQDYYVPSANGTFTGTEFYGYSAYEGSWVNSITITSYANNNKVTIKNIDDGTVIDTVTLMRGQVYTKGIYAPTYWAVSSQGPVTAANIPYFGWTGSYYYMTRAIDETGTGAGKLFYVPTIASNVRVFSFDNNNNVKITQLGLNTAYPYPSSTEIYNGTLNYGEVYSFNSLTGNMVYKIEGTGNVAVLQSNGGAGADFMPLSYASKLPDLTLSVDDIAFSVPDSVYVPGDVIRVTLTIRNTGAVDAENVPVVAYDGDPDIGSATPVANAVLASIKAGSYANYDFNYTIPIWPEYHNLVVKIDPNNFVVEANKSNNKAQRFLRANKDLLPPLAVTTTAPSALTIVSGILTPNPFQVRYDIFNTGTVSASNVQINLSLGNGLTLASGTNLVSLGNIPANGSQYVEYSINANKDSTGFNTFTATITASNADTKIIYRAINIPDNVPPNAPSNFSGSAIGNSSASFSWNANSEKDLGGYYLYYGTSSGNWNGTGADQGNSPLLVTGKTNYTITGLPLPNNQTTTYYFKLKAFDQSLNLSGDSQVLTLLITAQQASSIHLTSPIGGETWPVSSSQNITWTSSGITNVKLEYTTNYGTSWSTITASTPASYGSYTWTIPNTASTQCKVRVSDATNSTVNDVSSNTFTISSSSNPTITITSPNGGESWQVGTQHNITWSSSDVTSVKLEYTTDAGSNWQTIIESTSASAGSYSWTVPNTPSTNCKVRVKSGSVASVSAYVFTIYQQSLSMKFSIAVHQNPAATKYANIIVATESSIQGAPFVSVKSSLDSIVVPMVLLANSTTVYSGSYVFKTSSSHSIFSRITSTTGLSKDSLRTINVILAKPEAVTLVSSLDKKASLTINPKTIDEEIFFICGVDNENGEQVYSFSPGIAFNNKLHLEISYNSAQFTDVSKLFIYQKVDGGWMPIRSQVYPIENKVVAFVETLGKFKVAADPSFEGDNRVPNSFVLKQNYPNPFNPTTTLQYDLPENDNVNLVIYNILGKQVATLVNGYQLAGAYNITWEAKNDFGMQLSSGIYFYQIRTSKFSQVKKMILMR
ncbi:MAG: T9SS type A sorting domain-containing protein [Ignavibacteriaceae bacterium]|jgi:hypothetical protein|nr:T9SS type A sorting domain-containing protein [Ignavibacteriaceae bacterium]